MQRKAGTPRGQRRQVPLLSWPLPLLVVAVLGCCTLLLLLPKFKSAGEGWDPRRLPDGSGELTPVHALNRDNGHTGSAGQTTFRLFLSWHTLAGARSSFASLKAAFQGRSPPPLCIFLTGRRSNDPLAELERFAQQLEWPSGNVHVGESRADDALPFDWVASKDTELALLLDEGVRLSPHDVQWLQHATGAYENAFLDGGPLVGSFLAPALDYTALPKGAVIPGHPFLVQSPCFRGCAFFPGPWRRFRHYHHQRQASDERHLPSPPGVSPGAQRWERHLAEMMTARGLLALHPPLQADARPLQNSGRPPDLPAFTALPIFDADLRLVVSPDRLLYNAVAWAMRPILQSGDPDREALADALYGPLNTRQCILEHWTQTWHPDQHCREGRGSMKQVRGGQSSQRNWFNGQLEVEGRERFLYFSPQFGVSNQMLAYADTAALATVLNRTLVLAPLRQKDGTFIDVESVLDLEKLFRFTDRERPLTQPTEEDVRVPAIRHGEFMDSIMRGRPLRSLIRFDWSNRFGGREKDDAWFHLNGLLRSTTHQIELPTVALYRHSALLLLGGCSAHQVLALDIGFLATSWRQEAYGGDGSGGAHRYDAVRRQLHQWVHRPFRLDLVRQVAAAVRPLQPFTCLHLRRGDFAGYCAMIRDQRRLDPGGPYGIPFYSAFTYRNCFPNIAHLALLLNATSLIPTGQRLYIATNEPDRDLIALHFGDAFDWLDLEALQKQTAGLPGWLSPVLLDRLVCQQAAVLVGNRWSTFSRSIAQSGPGQSHYVGFGHLALLSRLDDDAELQLLRKQAPLQVFDTWQAVAGGGSYMPADERGEASRVAELLDFRLPAPLRACMQQPSEGPQGERFFYRLGYLRSRLPRHSHDVTLVTHAASTQLGLLRRLLRSWPGVLSVGYCVGPFDPSGQLVALRHLFQESEAAGRGRLDVSLLARDPLPDGVEWERTVGAAPSFVPWKQARPVDCPLPLLLELALDAALTELVAVVDPCATPSRHLYATWAQPRVYRRLREQAQWDRWLAVVVREREDAVRHVMKEGSLPLAQEISTHRQEQYYVLASRQQLPCLRHLAAADDDSAMEIARHLAHAGSSPPLLNSGSFTLEGTGRPAMCR